MTNIREKAMLVSLNVGSWSTTKTDKQAGLELAKSKGAEPDTVKARKVLLKSAALSHRASLVNRANTYHLKSTLPWLDGGLRVIPVDILFSEYFPMINELSADINKFADEFIDKEYDDARRRAKVALGELFDPSDYPEKFVLKRRFRFKVRVVTIPEPADLKDFRVDVDDDRAEMMKQITEQVEHDIYSNMARGCVERLQEPLSKMGDVLGNLDKEFRGSVIDNIKAQCDMVRKLNVANDAGVNDFIKETQALISKYSVDDLKYNGSARRDTVKQIEAIKKKMAAYA